MRMHRTVETRPYLGPGYEAHPPQTQHSPVTRCLVISQLKNLGRSWLELFRDSSCQTEALLSLLVFLCWLQAAMIYTFLFTLSQSFGIELWLVNPGFNLEANKWCTITSIWFTRQVPHRRHKLVLFFITFFSVGCKRPNTTVYTKLTNWNSKQQPKFRAAWARQTRKENTQTSLIFHLISNAYA